MKIVHDRDFVARVYYLSSYTHMTIIADKFSVFLIPCVPFTTEKEEFGSISNQSKRNKLRCLARISN